MFSTHEIEMFQMIVMANINNTSVVSSKNNNNNNVTTLVDLKKSSSSSEKDDLVARWTVPLCDKDYFIEFEHGTTSGKRVITINGKEFMRREWMFRLVGDEVFPLDNKHTCAIRINPKPAFNYSYLLFVDGLEIEEFLKKQDNIIIVWNLKPYGESGDTFRICLDKPSLDIWVNGEKIETEGEFIDEGTKTNFQINNTDAFILGLPSGNKKEHINYDLYYNGMKTDKVKLS